MIRIERLLPRPKEEIRYNHEFLAGYYDSIQLKHVRNNNDSNDNNDNNDKNITQITHDNAINTTFVDNALNNSLDEHQYIYKINKPQNQRQYKSWYEPPDSCHGGYTDSCHEGYTDSCREGYLWSNDFTSTITNVGKYKKREDYKHTKTGKKYCPVKTIKTYENDGKKYNDHNEMTCDNNSKKHYHNYSYKRRYISFLVNSITTKLKSNHKIKYDTKHHRLKCMKLKYVKLKVKLKVN